MSWGTDNGVAFNSALNAAQAVSGKVFVPQGNFFFGTNVTKDADNIYIQGSGEGLTVLMSGVANGNTLLSFGNTAGPSVRSNIYLEYFTIDMCGNFAWGLSSPWCRNVSYKNIRCINPGTGQFSMLYVGLFSNQNSSWSANNILLENIYIDYAGGGPTWEAITLGFARDVTLVNVSVLNKPSGPGVLTYNSEQVSFVGGHFLKSMVQVSGRGPTTFTGTRFENSYLYIAAADSVTVDPSVTFIGTLANQGTSQSCGVKIDGNYFPAAAPEVPFYITTFPYTWQCKNIVIGGTFQNCNSNAISSGLTTANSVTFLAAYDLTIQGISSQKSFWAGIDVAANYLTVVNNKIYGSGQAGTASVTQNFTLAAKYGIMSDNQSYNDQGTPTATRDVLFNNGYVTYLPNQAWNIGTNNLTINSGVFNFAASGGVISTTNPGNITVSSNFPNLLSANSETLTVPVGGNSNALTIVQNDTTNNPRGIDITQNSAGAAFNVQNNGTGNAAIFLDNSNQTTLTINKNNVGTAISALRNQTNGSGAMAIFNQQNVSDPQDAFQIKNAGTGSSLLVNNQDLSVKGGFVGVGVVTPAASAQLEVASTVRGFLPPRMTSTQRTAIASPAAGLMVWDTTVPGLYVYNGTVWKAATLT